MWLSDSIKVLGMSLPKPASLTNHYSFVGLIKLHKFEITKYIFVLTSALVVVRFRERMSHSIVFHWNDIDSYIHDDIKFIHPRRTFEALAVF